MQGKRILFGILCFFFSISAFAASEPHYLIILDGGSSHTAIYAYRYEMNSRSGLPENIATVSKASQKPGIENVDPNTISQYLSPLFSKLSHEIPKNTPLYLYGTAGMRLQSAEKQAAIYHSINQWLRQKTHFDVKAVQTISGNWEGAFDWLALNYLLSNLQRGQSTAGILDMGGASTEIVYELPANESANPESYLDLRLANRQYRLYTHSYLGLGEDQAGQQFSEDPDCYSMNFLLPDTTRGLGNYDSCTFHLERFINSIHQVREKTVPQIPSNTDFYAINGYYYIANSKLIGLGNAFTPGQLSQKASEVCASDWASLQMSDPNDPFLSQLCFNAAYDATLLTEGYGFAPTKILYDPEDINGEDLDWTLGILVYHAAKGR